jgi:hypothetical protein
VIIHSDGYLGHNNPVCDTCNTNTHILLRGAPKSAKKNQKRVISHETKIFQHGEEKNS